MSEPEHPFPSLPGGPREIRTERLFLRQWRPEDAGEWAALNGDPEVMEHFPATQSPEECAESMARFSAELDELGYGLWAVEVASSGAFIGFTGVHPALGLPCSPALEIGWRLSKSAWGFGFASEAARAALAFAFDEVGLAEVVSFTAVTNSRSEAVMQRIGMRRDPSRDFEHPRVDADSPLRPHVFYAITREQFASVRDTPINSTLAPRPTT